MSIRIKYDRKIKEVFEKAVAMCRNIELAIENSIEALNELDVLKAKEVIKNDKLIDDLEHEIEGDCLNLLLMENPVATDFREISSTLKMITDLERIGDQAADISSIVLEIQKNNERIPLHDITILSKLAINMVKNGVSSYINRDVNLARLLDKYDDEIDELFEKIKKESVELLKTERANPDEVILTLMIAKYLERIADHAVNIGEWAEYAITCVHKKG